MLSIIFSLEDTGLLFLKGASVQAGTETYHVHASLAQPSSHLEARE